MPVVTTLHTILRSDAEQKLVLQEVVNLSARVVSMAEKGIEFLRGIYETPEDKIDLIPHGIPDVPFADPNYYKDKFGAEGRPVLLTFGLLSPNKGIEHVLNALPAVVHDFPKVPYICARCDPSQSFGTKARLTGSASSALPRKMVSKKRDFFQPLRG
jgi:glycosyltransferase involved in cell wall biosynthesis